MYTRGSTFRLPASVAPAAMCTSARTALRSAVGRCLEDSDTDIGSCALRRKARPRLLLFKSHHRPRRSSVFGGLKSPNRVRRFGDVGEQPGQRVAHRSRAPHTASLPPGPGGITKV